MYYDVYQCLVCTILGLSPHPLSRFSMILCLPCTTEEEGPGYGHMQAICALHAPTLLLPIVLSEYHRRCININEYTIHASHYNHAIANC